MPRAPSLDEELTPLFISSISVFASAGKRISGTPAFGSMAWSTANTAVFIPVWIPFTYPIRRFWWQNGSAAGGNWDVGIYSIGGGAIFTAGSTAGAGNSAPQFVSPAAPVVLTPGSYMLALNHDATTANQAFGLTSFTERAARAGGCYTQAVGAVTLPAAATLAQYASTMIHFPIFGITRTASGF